MIGGRWRTTPRRVVLAIAAIVTSSVVLLPFLWLILTSVKTRSDIFTYPPSWLPRELTLSAYVDLFTKSPFADAGFLTFLRNSVIVAVASSALSIILAALAGFSLSRHRFRGAWAFSVLILVSQMLPETVLLIPLYWLIRDLGLVDSLQGLILVYTALALPFSAWMLRSYFDAIPRELDEAALMDGCGQVGVLGRVIMPLAMPGVAATFLFAFILAWNEYLFALVFLNDFDNYTISLALGSFRGQYLIDWNLLFAGSAVLTLPVLVMFLWLQQSLAQGLTAGAVRG